MAYKLVHVGTGGFGGHWCKAFLPPNIADGLIEVVAAVDVNPDMLVNARNALGLREDQCYTDVNKALDENKADICTVVVPPAFHESIVDAALAHDANVLSEKPIADTLEGACRIAEKVKSAGKTMGVTMSHRFRQDVTTLRTAIQSGEYGELGYLMGRFTADKRKYASWGAAFRHEIPDTLLIEGSVHHLDLMADMTGGKCDTLYAQTWNPSWGEYKGDSQGLVTMNFDNGVRAFYEGALTNAVGLNTWGKEYIRAECEDATLILAHGRLECFKHDPDNFRENQVEGTGEEIPLLDQPKWANTWLIEKFVNWLDGGEPMETNIEDNLQSVALVFSGIESGKTGNPVKVQELLQKTREEVTK